RAHTPSGRNRLKRRRLLNRLRHRRPPRNRRLRRKLHRRRQLQHRRIRRRAKKTRRRRSLPRRPPRSPAKRKKFALARLPARLCRRPPKTRLRRMQARCRKLQTTPRDLRPIRWLRHRSTPPRSPISRPNQRRWAWVGIRPARKRRLIPQAKKLALPTARRIPARKHRRLPCNPRRLLQFLEPRRRQTHQSRSSNRRGSSVSIGGRRFRPAPVLLFGESAPAALIFSA